MIIERERNEGDIEWEKKMDCKKYLDFHAVLIAFERNQGTLNEGPWVCFD